MLIMLQNNIAKKNDNQLVEFSANGEKVKLSPAIVRNYLVNGNGANYRPRSCVFH